MSKSKGFIKISHEDIDSGLFVGWSAPMFRVYFALMRHADVTGYCFPGYTRLQQLTGYKNRRDINKGLQGLEEAEIIKVRREPGHVNEYTFTKATSDQVVTTESPKLVTRW